MAKRFLAVALFAAVISLGSFAEAGWGMRGGGGCRNGQCGMSSGYASTYAAVPAAVVNETQVAGSQNAAPTVAAKQVATPAKEVSTEVQATAPSVQYSNSTAPVRNVRFRRWR